VSISLCLRVAEATQHDIRFCGLHSCSEWGSEFALNA